MPERVITAYFEADHDRLESLFGQYQGLKRTDIEAAKRYFMSFRAGLKRHIAWEEQVLFPLFDEKTGNRDSGPTAVMRGEHRRIISALDGIHEKVREGNPECDDEESDLLDVLAGHNQKEESVLYPSLDATISKEEAAELFLDMEEIPEEQYNRCCSA